jgi:capsular polysaccharide transport system permease protein
MARTSYEIQKAVVFALFVRELKTRFGKYRLGYVWALIEPLVHVIVLSAIWSILGRTEFMGIPVPLFLVTGIVPFLFFRSVVSRGINAIEANRGLFGFRQVRPVDTVLARILLESIVYFLAYLVLLFIGGWFLGYDVSMHNPLGLIAVNALLFFLSLGLGLLSAVYGALYPEIMKLVPMILLRPLYFISGILFPLYMIPSDYHSWLLWNPLLHVVELNHAYFFRSFESPETSLMFVFISAVTSLTLGLLAYRANWMRVLAT